MFRTFYTFLLTFLHTNLSTAIHRPNFSLVSSVLFNAASKLSGPISTPPPITVPEPVNDSLPTPSPRTFPETDTIEAATAEPVAMKVTTLSSAGRTTSNTSSIVSSETGPIVSPLPKVSPRSNMSSPGRKPKSFLTEQQLSSVIDTAATGRAPRSRRPSGTGGLPRVAMLAANKPAVPKREETAQRNTPPPFRSGGSSMRTAGGSTSGAATGRGRAPGTSGGASSTPTGASMNSRQRVPRGSASSSPSVPGIVAASGGISRSSSRSSTASASASSSSRLVPSNSTNSRPAWGSTASGVGGVPIRSMSARSTNSQEGAPGVSRTPPGTLHSTQSRRSTPAPAAGTTSTGIGTAETFRRTLSTSSAASSGAGRGRVVARSSSPSKIPGGPIRTTSTTSSTHTRPGGATAALAGAAAVGMTAATAAVLGKAATAEQPEEDLNLDTLVGLMGEIKDIRHALDMNTPTAADGTENTEFGTALLNEAEESLPGPEFIASVDTSAVGVGEEGDVVKGEGVDSLVKKERRAEDGVDGGEGKGSGLAAGEGAEGETDTAEEKLDDLVAVVEEEPAPVGIVEPRPAFVQQSAVEVEQEKIQAKPLCSCSIM